MFGEGKEKKESERGKEIEIKSKEVFLSSFWFILYRKERERKLAIDGFHS